MPGRLYHDKNGEKGKRIGRMRDEEYNGEEEYSDIDRELLRDFEDELAEEDRARRKKFIYMLGGLALGLALVLVIASRWGEERPPASPTPLDEEAAVEEESPASKDLDSQIAALKEQNMIDEDFKAPGALVNEEPMAPGGGEEPEAADEDADVADAIEQVETAEEESASEIVETLEEEPAAAAEVEEPKAEPAELEEEPALLTGAGEPETMHGEAEPAEPAEAVEKKEKMMAALVTPEPQEPKPVEKDDKWAPYSVQLLATTDAVEALGFRDDLLRRGFDSWISMGKVKKNVYSIECGEFESIKAASGLSGALSSAGFSTRTSYVKGGSRVTLVAGVYDDGGKAGRLAERIRAAGFPALVKNRRGPLDLYLVRVGRYKSRVEAERALETMKRSGYRTLGVVQ